MISRKDDSSNLSHVYKHYPIPLLKTTAIYGYNAAGKTNLLDSILKLRRIVVGKIKLRSNDDLMYYKMDESSVNNPTVFEIEFYSSTGNHYSYYLSVLQLTIVGEWLAVIDDSNNEPSYLFIREKTNNQTKLKVPLYDNDEKEKIRMEVYADELNKTDNIPFIRYGVEHGLSFLDEAYSWFEDTLEVVKPNAHYIQEISFLNDERTKRIAVQMLSFFELGIEDIRIKTIPLDNLFFDDNGNSPVDEIKQKYESTGKPVILRKNGQEYSIFKDSSGNFVAGRIVTVHRNNIEFELKEESMGTQMLLELIPGFVSSIVYGKVFLFDELESNKHPEMTKELLTIYQIAGENTPGQIIFTTHECHLLDLHLLRKDEIWFAERDKEGASHIYSLSDFQPTYNKEDIKTGYLKGQFSEIPFFSNPKNLSWHGNTETD